MTPHGVVLIHLLYQYKEFVIPCQLITRPVINLELPYKILTTLFSHQLHTILFTKWMLIFLLFLLLMITIQLPQRITFLFVGVLLLISFMFMLVIVLF